jgi:ABC-type uncharacterized transport system involved in gliding motility auxiliary subunit
MLKRVFDTVGWLGAALALSALAVFLLKAEWQPYSRWLALGGLACLLAYAIAGWRDVLSLFAGRSARLGTLSGLSIAIVLAILVAINYISAREHKRWDLPSSGQFTLSPQSVKVLASLAAPLKLTVFARDSEFPAYRDRLAQYEYVSKRVATEYIDPDKRPGPARQLGIQSYGTIAVQYKGRVERVVGTSEQDITNGIIKVVTGRERKVYFTQGHGEKDTGNTERTGYSGLAAQMAHDNYKVEKLALAQAGQVPEDAAAVIVAGPRTDFLPGEIDALKAYLGRGGHLMLLLDPPDKVDSPPLTALLALAHDWGMDVGNDIVVDISGVGRLIGTDETVPVAVNYPSHPIVQGLDTLTAFPLARSVTAVSGGVGGHYAQAFVETSAKSWAETDLKTMLTGGKVSLDVAKGDRQGPITIAAAASAPVTTAADKAPAGEPRPESRVVVFGDSDFAANLALGVSGNRDLFMNAVNWLAQQENLIAIRPREADDRRLTMTAGQQRQVTILSLFLVPLFVLVSGLYAWSRRR